MCLVDLGNHAFYACRDPVSPLMATVVMVLVNIGCKVELVKYLAHGGLALSTSIAVLTGAGLLSCRLRCRLHWGPVQ